MYYAMFMKNIIQFSISRGEKFYIAHAVDFPIFTQGETLDELIKNIQEATELHFLDENLSDNGFSQKPSLFVNFEIPQHA
jgi:predicted RNase H-like HicB family nuclease